MEKNNLKKYKIFLLMMFMLLTLTACSSNCQKECLNACQNNQDNTNNMQSESTENFLYYDCSYTRTYKIIDTFDYPFANGYEYIVVDAFQRFNPSIAIVPIGTSENLEMGKSYEFTYTLKGNGKVNEYYDSSNLTIDFWLKASLTSLYDDNYDKNPNSLFVTLNIKEPICEGKTIAND